MNWKFKKHIGCENISNNYLEEFRKELAPLEKLFTEEIKKFAKNYDFLSEVNLVEIPDIFTQEYVYAFKKIKDISTDEADKVRNIFHKHMNEFSEEHNLQKFNRKTTISFRGEIYEDD